jgi:hypothetical protein
MTPPAATGTEASPSATEVFGRPPEKSVGESGHAVTELADL